MRPTSEHTFGDRNEHGGHFEVLPRTPYAAQITTEQVGEIATAAEKNDPSVLNRVGAYYAQHPQLVKALGGTALAIALAQVAKRMNR